MKELSGTKYEGRRQQDTFQTIAGKEANSMTLKEYNAWVLAAQDCFESASPEFKALYSNITLIHDGAMVHHKKKIPGIKWTPVKQPPHSPDMMPLYYAIFGFTNVRLQRAVLREIVGKKRFGCSSSSSWRHLWDLRSTSFRSE